MSHIILNIRRIMEVVEDYLVFNQKRVLLFTEYS